MTASAVLSARHLLAFLPLGTLQLVAASWLPADKLVVVNITYQPLWADVCSFACGQAYSEVLYRCTGLSPIGPTGPSLTGPGPGSIGPTGPSFAGPGPSSVGPTGPSLPVPVLVPLVLPVPVLVVPVLVLWVPVLLFDLS